MKIKLAKLKADEGSAILVTMILTFVISLMVAGAMRMVSHELVFSVHSANWAQSLHTAEAGVEIALAALQQQVSSAYEWSSCGWTGTPDTWTRPIGSLDPTGHGAPPSQYNVTLNISDPAAYTVMATGTMPEPRTGGTLTRTVRVTLEPDWFRRWEKGMLGKDIVDFQGNPDCDSYDSTLGPYGAGNVAANCSIGSMSIAAGGIAGGGSPVVKGDVFVTETGDAVGGFWTGAENNDLDVDIPSYTPARTDMTDPAITGGETFTVSSANDYIGVPSIAPQGAQKWVTVQGEGKLTIYVAGDTDFGTATDLNIIPDAGKELQLVIESNGDLNLKGTLNATGDPLDLLIFGTENCVRMEVEANNDKYLCVYAPDAEVQLSGNAQIFGSIVGKELDVQGNFSFHYDESLTDRAAPVLVGYDIMDWEEL